MSETTTYPHQDLISEHKIAVTDLPEKTQKKIAKFASADEEAKEALDEVIYQDVEDFIEAKAKAAKAAATKEKIAEHKKKKLDVSQAATATGAKTKEQLEAEAATAAAKPRGLMKTIFGQQ